jgi:hypothetical protein
VKGNDDARDLMVEAEKSLFHPDMFSLAAGIEFTPRPLREVLKSGDDTDCDAAMNALVALAQGPNGQYRRIAVFAIGQLGVCGRQNDQYPRTVDWITSAVQDGKTQMATDEHR